MSKRVVVHLKTARTPDKRSYRTRRIEVTAHSVTDALGKAVAQNIADGFLGKVQVLRIMLSPLVWLRLDHIHEAVNGNGPHAGSW